MPSVSSAGAKRACRSIQAFTLRDGVETAIEAHNTSESTKITRDRDRIRSCAA